MAENVVKIKSRIGNCVNMSAKIQSNTMRVKKNLWKPSTCACETNRYLQSIAADLVMRCDDIIDTSETVTLNFNKKNVYSLLAFLLIIMPLLITLSVYHFYYHIRHRSK